MAPDDAIQAIVQILSECATWSTHYLPAIRPCDILAMYFQSRSNFNGVVQKITWAAVFLSGLHQGTDLDMAQRFNLCDLDQLVEDCIARFRLLIEEKGCEVVLKYRCLLPLLRVQQNLARIRDES